MLVKPPIEELLPQVDNRYVLAMLAAKRARQLTDGAEPMAEIENQSMVTVAASELAQDHVRYVDGKVDVAVPLRPEIALERLIAEKEAQEKQRELFDENQIMPSMYKRSMDNDILQDITDKEDAKSIAEQLMRMVTESESTMQSEIFPDGINDNGFSATPTYADNDVDGEDKTADEE